MPGLLWAIGFAWIALLLWKFWMIVSFFRRSLPPVNAGKLELPLVSILQPILSGDPTLPATLAQNLNMATAYPVEYLWLLDEDDATVKLLAGHRAATGQVLCVLDDDTILPDFGMEQCPPFLDAPGIGLAFGLPYQVNFATFWSAMIACFVNSSSLLTYVPYSMLHEPVTINGMFYAVKRALWETIGGWEGLETVLADDFAVAQKVRSHTYLLAQTPLRHAISTQVRDAGHYTSLIQRWFIFPRESIMRHLPWREQFLVYGLAMAPIFAPLLLFIGAVVWPANGIGLLLGAALLLHYAVFAWCNQVYLSNATPWAWSWLVPLIQLIFPLQLLAALIAPQRIVWRGHLIEVQRGGGFRFVTRRPPNAQ
ncbi:MAG: glycosyltransferase family 2 protein [Anaerolineales bacterium]|nr:glycosyltransferase family 2 protein [Anaerolineales bacterium]